MSPNPHSPDHLWCASFMALLLGLLPSSQTLVRRGLCSVIWTGMDAALLENAEFLLYPQLCSLLRIPLFSLLPRSYFQRFSCAPTSSRKPSLACWNPETRDPHYLNWLSWHGTSEERPRNSSAPCFLSSVLLFEEYIWFFDLVKFTKSQNQTFKISFSPRDLNSRVDQK